jgi:hypothetical protein
MAPTKEKKRVHGHGSTNSNADTHRDSSNSKLLLQKVNPNNTHNLVNNKAKAAPIALRNILLICAEMYLWIATNV